jgi:hypothetical protein
MPASLTDAASAGPEVSTVNTAMSPISRAQAIGSRGEAANGTRWGSRETLSRLVAWTLARVSVPVNRPHPVDQAW